MKIRDAWSSHPTTDWLAVALVSVLYVVVPLLAVSARAIAELTTVARTGLYQTLAGISGALLGFAIAAVAILLGLGDGPRLDFVRKSKWAHQIAKTFTGAVRALALTTLVFVLALLYDAEKTASSLWELLVVAAVALAAFRTIRATWLLNNLVDLAYRDTTPAKPA